MNALNIAATVDTPRVLFDKQSETFVISGKSLPEDTLKFYSPLHTWLNEYFESPNQVTELHLKLDYLNSASSKAIAELLSLLESKHIEGKHVKVIWKYLDIDEDGLETGEEFDELYKIPFEFLPFTQDNG